MFIIKSVIISAVVFFGFIENKNEVADSFWLTNYEQAVTQAKNQDRPLMLYFSGSDWCKPCIIWKKEVFDTESFQQYANNTIVPVKLDFPRLKKNRLPDDQVQQNESLAKKYNNEGVFPMVVFIDAEGSVIEKSSYREGGPDEFILYAESVLNKSN